MTFGPKLFNPAISLSPGALSTWQPPRNTSYSNYDCFMIGKRCYDPNGLEEIGAIEGDGISPLDGKDLASPTWGLGASTSTNSSKIPTIGPPWLSLIVPPIEMFFLDPT